MSARYAQLPVDHFCDDRRIGCADAEVIVAELVLGALAKRLESDGLVTRLQARKELAGCAFIRDVDTIANRLVEHGFARDVDATTIELADWRLWMLPKAEVDAYRAQQAARARSRGRNSGETRCEPAGLLPPAEGLRRTALVAGEGVATR